MSQTDYRTTNTRPHDRWADAWCIAFGVLTTLVVSGYQFGRGNHTVYLLEGLHLNDPTLFRRDWFVSQTLQYHAIFSHLTAWLMKLNVLEPAFVVGYLALAIAWHIAWLKFTLAVGGSRVTYALSVILYYLSAAGIGLGVYQFLQDGTFLPSNVSSVAMVSGFYLWATNRRAWAGVALGIAGLFHLNYAVVAIGAWCALLAWSFLTDRKNKRDSPFYFPPSLAATIVGTLFALVPSAVNILLALRVAWSDHTSIPMDEFVKVYIRFRHAHHFDPLNWPIGLWIGFLWPIPLAIWAWTKHRRENSNDSVLSQTARIFVLMFALQVIAFVFAGVFYVSESLVQLMLWRFSIYVKLLSCIGAAWIICESGALKPVVSRVLLWIVPVVFSACVALLLPARIHLSEGIDLASIAIRNHRNAFILFAALSFLPALISIARPRRALFSRGGVVVSMFATLILTIAGWGSWLGWGMTPELVDAEYLKVCKWAEEATPLDAIFLVPPAETVFRLEARRAIVVNYKHIPQLPREIVQWTHRLQDVLDTPDVSIFPTEYVKTMKALDERYNASTPERLLALAEKYDARYIVVDRDWGPAYFKLLAYRTDDRRYFVYDRAG